MFKLIPINKHLVDVFYGEEGWEEWSRVSKHKGSMKVVGGLRNIPPHVWKAVKEAL